VKDADLPALSIEPAPYRVIGEPKLTDAHIQIRAATEDEHQHIEKVRELRRTQDEEIFWNLRMRNRP
jgi:hypothetical protein